MAATITRSSVILNAWKTHIWTHADVVAITENILHHDITEIYHKEMASLRHNQEINFFSTYVIRSLERVGTNNIRPNYIVRITYVRYADPDGLNYQKAIDAIETVQELVIDELGENWQGTVAGYDFLVSEPNIIETTIENIPVFQVDYGYVGFKCTIGDK